MPSSRGRVLKYKEIIAEICCDMSNPPHTPSIRYNSYCPNSFILPSPQVHAANHEPVSVFLSPVTSHIMNKLMSFGNFSVAIYLISDFLKTALLSGTGSHKY